MDNNIIQVYTDGSCNTKLKIGAWAAIIIHNNNTKTISGYTLETTNNRMELTAVIKALEYIETNYKNINKMVNVADIDCLNRKCYWPRPDPGIFTQGFGYRQRNKKPEWLCGTREIHGCPNSVTKHNQ